MNTQEEEDFAKIKCPYLYCCAGMGVAGALRCFLGGDYTDIKCGKFEKDMDIKCDKFEKDIE